MAGQITVSTLRNDTGVFATQNGMTGIAKAWVNFGYVSSAIVTRGSFNVSSITRSAAGRYTITMTTALADANYATVITGSIDATANNWATGYANAQQSAPYYVAPTSTVFSILFLSAQNAALGQDPVYANIAVLGN